MVSPSVIAEPASMPQVRTLAGEFERIGYTRDGRLAAAADILGIDSLSSFRDLTRDQAGHLFAWIRHPERAAARRAGAAPGSHGLAAGREPGQPDARASEAVTEAEAAISLVLAAAVLFVRRRQPLLSSQAA